MKRICSLPVLVLAVLSLAAALARAQAKQQLEEFDARIIKELAGQNPDAVPVFAAANQARDRGDYARAAELYAKVRELAPKFSHAVRRLGSTQLELGRRKQAIATLNEARVMEDIPETLSALASALGSSQPDSQHTPAELKEALQWASAAAERSPDDYVAQLVFADLALKNDDMPSFKKGVSQLLKVAPQEMGTFIYKALLDLSESDYSAARRSLTQAKTLGLAEDQYQEILKLINSSEPWPLRFLPAAGITVGVWALALLILFALGWGLSKAALKSAKQLPPEDTGRAQGVDAALRRVYAAVLWLCSAFYWVSLPVVAALVLLAGGGALYAFVTLGRIPIKLVVIIVIMMFSTITALVRSLSVKAKETDPGPRLDIGKNPRLKDALQEVAGKVGTRPVDVVFLTPGSDVAVFERGGMAKQLRGAPQRALILGAAALDGLRLMPFKAILAHEYGHFSNRDTAGGGFAMAVLRSLMIMGRNLGAAGVARWYNPAWLFLNAFHRIFLRLSHGASRLQEVLADRWAAFAYGARAFEEGLRHVVGQGVRFNAQVNATIKEAADGKLCLSNLYSFRPSQIPPEEDLQKQVELAINAKPSPYDSHPPSQERFAMVRALKTVEPASPDDTAMAWDLFSDRQEIEREMTRLLRENLERQGMTFAEEPEAKAAQA